MTEWPNKYIGIVPLKKEFFVENRKKFQNKESMTAKNIPKRSGFKKKKEKRDNNKSSKGVVRKENLCQDRDRKRENNKILQRCG